MAKKENRFIVSFEESRFTAGTQILADKETGVNYLYHYDGYGGGLTVMLDADGKPLVTKVEE